MGKMIKTYYDNKLVLEGGDQNEIQEQLICEILKKDEADQGKTILLQEYLSEKQPYAQIRRGYGAGELRLNKSIEFGEDIFSLAFCCEVKDSILAQNFDALTGKVQETPMESRTVVSINGNGNRDE